MNRNTAQHLRRVICAMIDDNMRGKLKQLGYDIKLGDGRFGESEITFKLSIASISADGDVMTKERTALKNRYPKYFDKRVTLVEGTGTVVEYHSRRSRYPFIVVMDGGGRYKVNEASIQIKAAV